MPNLGQPTRSVQPLAPTVLPCTGFFCALTTIGIFRENEDRRFTATAMSELLRSDHPTRCAGGPSSSGVGTTGPCGEICSTLSGRARPQCSTSTERMSGSSGRTSPRKRRSSTPRCLPWRCNLFHAIVDAYDFDRFDRIVDVGGGDGNPADRDLAVYLHPRGVVFDLPYVVQEATAEIDRAGVGSPLRGRWRELSRRRPRGRLISTSSSRF